MTLTASAVDTHLPSLVNPHRLRISQSPTANTPAVVSFETTPGVLYTLEKSDDLSSWEPVDRIYGLGHSINYPLANSVSVTSADGTVQQEKPEMVAATISRLSDSNQILIRWFPTAGEGSYTHSHDGQHSHNEHHTHETHSTALVEFELSANWDSVIPLSTHQIGATMFSISYGGSTELTEADHPIIENDGPIPAGISKLIENLDTINQNVHTNHLTPANSNNFSGATSSQSNFVRLRINWSLDSDEDGIPDWSEFKLAADTSSQSNNLGFAFNPDANEDGIVDGLQTDSDSDGLIDMQDPAPEDPTIDWLRQPEMRYAVFPITGSNPNIGEPLQINDLGQVLFHKHIWQNGELKELTTETDEIRWCIAMGMNNQGQVLGFGVALTEVHWYAGNPSGGFVTYPSVACLWETPESDPILIWGDDDRVAGADILSHLFYTAHSYPADSLIDDTGRFIAPKLDDGKPHGLWRRRQGGDYSFEEIDNDLFYVLGPNLSWGNSRVCAGDTEIKSFNQPLLKLTRRPSNELVALFEGSNSLHRIHGNWKKSSQFKAGIDMSANGLFIDGTSTITRVAKTGSISDSSKLLKKENYDLAELAPDFEIPNAQCVDISPKGWILVTTPEHPSKVYAALPLALGKPAPGWGIDVTSIRSIDPGEASENRAWVMVNQSGTQEVEISAPLSPLTQLTLESDLASMTPSVLTGLENAVSFQGTSDEYSDELLQLKLGSISSLSNPIGLKSMPQKTVKIALWPISNQYPGPEPTADEWAEMLAEINPYWDDLFGQQCGLKFQITRQPISKISWDIMGVDQMLNFLSPEDDDRESLREKLEKKKLGFKNGLLEIGYADNPTIEQNVIIDKYLTDTVSINLFCVENAVALRRFVHTTSGSYQLGAGGVASPGLRDPWVFIPVANTFGNFSDQIIKAKETIAHEFGHIVVQEAGHPHQGADPAPLPGTDRTKRLLGYDGENTLLVKAEWDLIQDWVKLEIARNRIE